MGEITYKAKLVYFHGSNKPIAACDCRYCENEWMRVMDELDPDGWLSRLGGGMNVCPLCGCKRCPKATYHDHECTRSNDAGQHNSVYGDFELDSDWMDDDE